MDKLTSAEFASLSQDNITALFRSGEIWAAGVQDLSRQAAATARATMETTLGSVSALFGAKTLPEAIELQARLSRSLFERATEDGGKFAETSRKLAEDSFAPLKARFDATLGRFAKSP